MKAEGCLVLGFPEGEVQARALAKAAGLPYAGVAVHRFPDGESQVRLPPKLPERVVIHRSLDHPNEKLVELALTVATARDLGARQLTLVAPYLCYMRQDAAFVPGEAVSQRILGSLLAGWFDELVTVDPHLHRVARLADAVPVKRAICLSAAGPMAEFLAQALDHPLVLGPDSESRQWVAAVAAAQGLDHGVAAKERLGDREVRIALPGLDPHDRAVVLVDDMVSTGHTLIATAEALRPLGPASISVLVTHGLFVEGALERLAEAGITQVWSSDSVPHSTNRVHLARLLADAVNH
jgi:ribose-phosphate pyrophosphokinase